MSVEQLRFKDPTDFGDAITKFGSYARAFLLVSDPNSALRSYFFQNWANFCPLSPQKKTILVQVWSCLGLVFQKYMLLADKPEGLSVVPARHTAHEPHRCARTFQSTVHAESMANESRYRKTVRQKPCTFDTVLCMPPTWLCYGILHVFTEHIPHQLHHPRRAHTG